MTPHHGFAGRNLGSDLNQSGEAYSALRGWRPIPAAPLTRFHPSVFPGRGPSLSLQGQRTPDKTHSIRNTPNFVKRNRTAT